MSRQKGGSTQANPAQRTAPTHHHSDNSLGQIVQQFGKAYAQKYNPNYRIIKTLEHIANCRTSALGGHLVRCTACGYEKINYNSCGDSNCPSCQNLRKELWIDRMVHHLLPVQHFHVIFTVPHQLNDLFFYNQKIMYTLFFHSAWQTIQQVTEKGQSGMVATLHTWGSNLSYHPHIHCIIPKGSLIGSDWKMGNTANPRFFVSFKLLRETFKNIFIKKITKLIVQEKLRLKEAKVSAADFQKIKQVLNKITKLKWSVRVEVPILGVQQIIEYLGRYVKRVAITNSRIMEVAADKVTFQYNDYAQQTEGKPAPKATLTLDGATFLQRFTQHISPPYFQRVRYFGVYAFCAKKKKEAAFLSIQGQPQLSYQKPNKRQLITKMLGIDPDVCPDCACYMTLETEDIGINRAALFKFKASKDSETWSHHATLFKVKVDFDKVVF